MSFTLSTRKQSKIEKTLYDRECPIFVHIYDNPYTPSEQVWTYYTDFFKLMDAMCNTDELKDGLARSKRISIALKKFVVKTTNNLHKSVVIVYVNLNGKYVVVLRENGLANKYKENYGMGNGSVYELTKNGMQIMDMGTGEGTMNPIINERDEIYYNDI